MQAAGWRVFRTPLIWVNPSAMRAPWPEHGPQRKYQLILYAIKGDKSVNQLYRDVIVYSSDENLGHQAQKPVGLYRDLFSAARGQGTLFLTRSEARALCCQLRTSLSAERPISKRMPKRTGSRSGV